MATAGAGNQNLKTQLAQTQQQTGLQTDEKPKTVLDLIKEKEQQFLAALPDHIGKDRFMQILMIAIRGSEKLKACTASSLMAAAMQCAQLGLEPNTPLHECSLIPYKKSHFKNGQWQDTYEAQFNYEYRGLVKLVWQSGLVTSLEFDKVCENDKFTYKKTSSGIVFEHEPIIKGDRGEAYAYYACAMTKGDGFCVVVKSKDEIIEHAKIHTKNKTTDKKSKEVTLTGTWEVDGDSFDAMCMKTVLKELADKKLPKSTDRAAIEFQRKLSFDGTFKNDISEDMSAVSANEVFDADYTIASEESSEESPEVTEPQKATDENIVEVPKEKEETKAEDTAPFLRGQ